MSGSSPRIAMLKSVVAALILTLFPLPSWLQIVRPAFLALTVLYWSIAAPRAGGITLGWICGLLLDAFEGPVLGEHALALAFLAYIGVREHQRIRSKPIFQQALIVLPLLAGYEGVLFAIDGWSGHALTTPLRWIPTLTGALIWPAAAAILARSYRQQT